MRKRKDIVPAKLIIKCGKVFKSCSTNKQLDVAYNFLVQIIKKYKVPFEENYLYLFGKIKPSLVKIPHKLKYILEQN